MRAPAAAARAVVRAAAAGWAQVLFCASPRAGLLLLAGSLCLAPRAAATGALACLGATAWARALAYPEPEWRRGLYGYAAALTGVFWGALFAPGPGTWLALGVATLGAPPLTRLAHRLLTPRELPALALPVLALVWAAWPLLPAAPAAAPPGLGAQALGWGLALAGLAAESRGLALAAAGGAAVGGVVAWALASPWPTGALANSVATAAALGGVFVPASTAGAALAAVGAAVAAALWDALARATPVPPLVAPFTLVTLATLRLLRAPAVRRALPRAPAPLPLLAVGRPEDARAAWEGRRRLAALVGRARRVAALTGAGVSTAAGIPDVRGPRGLWARTAGITLAEFVRSPAARTRYWREEERFFRRIARAAPTVTHRALAELHRRGRLVAVVTQNVDGLHQAAGLPAHAVVELHGSIHEARCLDCGARVARPILSPRIAAGARALYCPACQGLLAGGGVMLGEPVSAERLDAALRAILAADLLLVLGTSLRVAPAADLVRCAGEAGIPVAIVNAAPTPYDAEAAVVIRADVGAVLLDLLTRPEAAPDAPVAR